MNSQIPSKSERQKAILEIVASRAIHTQEEMVKALQDRQMIATQATVSRDIRELRLTKVTSQDGTYFYAMPENPEPVSQQRRFLLVMESILSVENAMNLVVVKTLSGSASAVAEVLDSMAWPDVVGTLAGDNTIMIVTRDLAGAELVVQRIRGLNK